MFIIQVQYKGLTYGFFSKFFKMGDLIHNGVTQEFSIVNEETLYNILYSKKQLN